MTQIITDFRAIAETTERLKNAENLLGIEIHRDRDSKLIAITFQKKILSLKDDYPLEASKSRQVPMPKNGYLVRDYELDSLPHEQRRLLDPKEQLIYMSKVGKFIWLQTIRFDILFVVMYLSWYTHSPRVHHMRMADYLIGYLVTTHDLPLVLGGDGPITIIGESDMSLGTGPKSKSINGNLTRRYPGKVNSTNNCCFIQSRRRTGCCFQSFPYYSTNHKYSRGPLSTA